MDSHLIHRQILEIRVAGTEPGRAVQERLSILCRERLPEIITHACDQFAPAGRTIRMERLELDLGGMKDEAMEEQFLRAFAIEFSAALAPLARADSGRHQPGNTPEANSALELLTHFISTGTLPWHVSAQGETQPVQTALRTLLTQPPERWLPLIQKALDRNDAAARLVSEVPDTLLMDLVVMFAPWSANELRDLLSDLAAAAEELAAWQTLGVPRRRLMLWLAVLDACTQSVDHASRFPSLVEVHGTVFHSFATRLLPPSPTTIPSGSLRRLLTCVQVAALTQPMIFLRDRQRRTRIWRGVLHASSTPADGTTGHASSVARMPQAEAAAAAAFASSPWAADLAGLLGINTVELLAGNNESPRAHAKDPTPALAQHSHAWRGHAPQARPQSVEDSFSAPHAGLAILWPFLARFLQSLNLLAASQRAFVSPDAAAHAALVLAHLATGQTPASAAFLSMEKVLCGLPPDAPLPIEAFQPTGDETQACAELLTAVTGHHRLWSTLSPDAFRHAWLQRPGLLRLSPAGSWTLHVERQAQDVILDHLPWPLEVVRHPWMEGAVWVEWRVPVNR